MAFLFAQDTSGMRFGSIHSSYEGTVVTKLSMWVELEGEVPVGEVNRKVEDAIRRAIHSNPEANVTSIEVAVKNVIYEAGKTMAQVVATIISASSGFNIEGYAYIKTARLEL